MYNLYIYDYADIISDTNEETIRQALAKDIEDCGLTESIYDIICTIDTEGDIGLYVYTKDDRADERSLKLPNTSEVIQINSITFVKGRSML